MKTIKLKPAVVVYLSGLVIIHIAVFWNLRRLVEKGYSDFTIYYCAARIVRQGLGHELYDDQTQFRVQQEFSKEVSIRQGPLPFNHPPFEALLFLPFTSFSYLAAFALWDLVNLAMLVVLPFLLRPYLPMLQSHAWPLWMLAMLAFFPIFLALLQGQDAILLLFLYTLAYVCLKKKYDAWAGCWLALGLFKFHLVVPLVVLLVAQGRKKVCYGFGAVAAVLTVVSFAVAGRKAMISYPNYVLRVEGTTAGGAISPAGMPNLRGFLWSVLPSNVDFRPLVFMLSVGIVFYAAWHCRGKENLNLFDFKFSLAAVVTVFVSYHAMAYDLSILMLPTFLVANELLRKESVSEWPGWLMSCAGAGLFFSPLPLLLLMRYGHLAMMGLAVLLCLFGIARLISAQTPENVGSPKVEIAG
jgi:hypothetical protein